MPPSERVLLLVARPTPSGIDERSLRALAAAVAERTAQPVRTAHLDQAEPSLHDALDTAAAEGAPGVLVVPLAVPEDRYLTAWIGRAVAHWGHTRGAQLDVRLASGLTSAPGLADTVAALGATGGTAATASPAGFAGPAWSRLPDVERHLLVCRGPRCTAYGAGATHRALAAAARDPATLVTPIGCVGPCNLGPLVIEHPGGRWHQQVDAVRAAELGPRPTPPR